MEKINNLAGNFQKTIRFAAHLLDTLEYIKKKAEIIRNQFLGEKV